MLILQLFLISFVALPVVAFLFRRARGPWQALTYSVAINMAVLIALTLHEDGQGAPAFDAAQALLLAFIVLSPIFCVFQLVFNSLFQPEGPSQDKTHKLNPEEVDMDAVDEVVIVDVASPY